MWSTKRAEGASSEVECDNWTHGWESDEFLVYLWDAVELGDLCVRVGY